MNKGQAEICIGKTVSVLLLAAIVTVAQGSITAFAAERVLGPKGKNASVEIGNSQESAAAAAGNAGEAAGKSVSKGVSIGTIGFSIAMVAGTIAIGVATLGGGGSPTTAHH